MRIRRPLRGVLLAAAAVTALVVALPVSPALAATTAAQTSTIAITGQAGKVVAATGVPRAYSIGGADGRPGVVVIDTATGSSLGPIAALQDQQVVDIAASPSSSLVVVTTATGGVGRLVYLDGATGSVTGAIDLPSLPGLVAVSDQGQIVVEARTSIPTAMLVVDQQVVSTDAPLLEPLVDLEFAPTAQTAGRIQAVAINADGGVIVLDTENGDLASFLNVSFGPAASRIAFQPGVSRALVTSASTGEVRVFGYADMRQASGVG